MAERLIRGDIYLCRFGSPDKQRPVVIITRDAFISYASSLVVAPITSTIRGAAFEVLLTEDDGMKHLCAINLLQTACLPKDRLGQFVTRLSLKKESELCSSLRFALGCD